MRFELTPIEDTKFWLFGIKFGYDAPYESGSFYDKENEENPHYEAFVEFLKFIKAEGYILDYKNIKVIESCYAYYVELTFNVNKVNCVDDFKASGGATRDCFFTITAKPLRHKTRQEALEYEHRKIDEAEFYQRVKDIVDRWK